MNIGNYVLFAVWKFLEYEVLGSTQVEHSLHLPDAMQASTTPPPYTCREAGSGLMRRCPELNFRVSSALSPAVNATVKFCDCELAFVEGHILRRTVPAPGPVLVERVNEYKEASVQNVLHTSESSRTRGLESIACLTLI